MLQPSKEPPSGSDSFRKTDWDVVTLKSLKIHGLHGYYDHERQHGNHFEVDLIASGRFSGAIEGNDLTQTFDYEAAESIIRAIFAGPSEKLIETLCERTGREIMSAFPHVAKLTVALRKCNPPINSPAKYAEIQMSWKRP